MKKALGGVKNVFLRLLQGVSVFGLVAGGLGLAASILIGLSSLAFACLCLMDGEWSVKAWLWTLGAVAGGFASRVLITYSNKAYSMRIEGGDLFSFMPRLPSIQRDTGEDTTLDVGTTGGKWLLVLAVLLLFFSMLCLAGGRVIELAGRDRISIDVNWNGVRLAGVLAGGVAFGILKKGKKLRKLFPNKRTLPK